MFKEAIAEFDLSKGFVVVLDSVRSLYMLDFMANYPSGLMEVTPK
jgi:hypothetical protein